MSDFLDILTHGRRLQGATKELSISELKAVSEKLQNIIENRQQKEVELEKERAEKAAKLEAIRQQMIEAGLSVEDLAGDAPKKTRGARKGQKRPVKYRLKDKDGSIHEWTGIGRMPLVYKAALESGKSLESFKI